jgi:phospholipid transport system substrate-binding protein
MFFGAAARYVDALGSSQGLQRMNRRAVLAAALAGVAAGMPAPLYAQDAAAADFIQGMAERAIGVLERGGAGTAGGKAEFRRILSEGFDIRTIGRFVLGRYWNEASESQRQEYLSLFQTMIVETYSRRFEGYSGETLVVKSTRAVGDRGDTMVQTEINQISGPPVGVDWRVRRSDRGYRVVDVIVANVSMSVTQRDEFASVIQQSGSIDGLLAVMRQRSSG